MDNTTALSPSSTTPSKTKKIKENIILFKELDTDLSWHYLPVGLDPTWNRVRATIFSNLARAVQPLLDTKQTKKGRQARSSSNRIVKVCFHGQAAAWSTHFKLLPKVSFFREVKALEAFGYLVHESGYNFHKDGQSAKLSSLRATRKFVDEVYLPVIEPFYKEQIAENKCVISCSKKLQNRLSSSELVSLHMSLLTFSDTTPRRKLFTAKGEEHGRYYTELTSLGKDIRRSLEVNGEPVVEVDISACHPRLLYALEGLESPSEDPYELVMKTTGKDTLASLLTVPGTFLTRYELRQVVKTGFMLLLNAKSRDSANKALLEQIRDCIYKAEKNDGISIDKPHIQHFVEAVQTQKDTTGYKDCCNILFDSIISSFPEEFRKYWFSSKAIKLMKTDSDILTKTIEILKKRNKISHPHFITYHDSVVIAQSNASILKEALKEAWCDITLGNELPDSALTESTSSSD